MWKPGRCRKDCGGSSNAGAVGVYHQGRLSEDPPPGVRCPRRRCQCHVFVLHSPLFIIPQIHQLLRYLEIPSIMLGLCDMEIQNCFYFGLETSDSWSEIQPTELFPERLSVSRRVCLLQLIELEAKTTQPKSTSP